MPGETVVMGAPGVEYAAALEDKLSVRTRLFDIQYYDPLVVEGSAFGKAKDVRRWTEWNASRIQECFDLVVVMMKQWEVDWEVLERCDSEKISIIYGC
jgi:hypothetical protein